MELIVKIGADQQGLQDTLSRIKQNFNNMNMSMPASWAGATPRGGIMAPPPMGAESASALTNSVAAGAMARFSGFLRGGIYTILGGLLTEGLIKANEKFWERYYGADPETLEKIRAAHEKLRDTVTDLKAARAVAQERTLREMSPHERLNVHLAKRADLDAEVAKRKAEFDSAREDYEAQKSPEARKLNGEPITNYDRRESTVRMAEKEARYLEAKEQRALLEDSIKKSENEIKTQGLKNKYRLEDGRLVDFAPKKEEEVRIREEIRRDDFQSDMLSQAGLFTGSSVLAPNFNGYQVQQEQLEVLREISAKLPIDGYTPFA